MLDNAWLDRTEPFSEAEWAKIRAQEIPVDHEELEQTISQFEACVQEILYLQPYRETVYE